MRTDFDLGPFLLHFWFLFLIFIFIRLFYLNFFHFLTNFKLFEIKAWNRWLNQVPMCRNISSSRVLILCHSLLRRSNIWIIILLNPLWLCSSWWRFNTFIFMLLCLFINCHFKVGELDIILLYIIWIYRFQH